jgi:asparagine synthase (glutamine-hydrolysing)
MSLGEAVEEYRHVLSAVVECRLRRRSGLAAVHLSAGYDSSSIAATAATLAGSAAIAAYTAAPSPGYSVPAPAGRLADESPIAAMTAARYAIRHTVVHSTDFTLDYLRRQARLYQEPLRNSINGLWTDEIRQLAGRSGASVLLNGMGGNMTLNSGGTFFLPEWLRQRGFVQWWRQAKTAARRDDNRWRGVLFSSFAPWLPTSAWWVLWRVARPYHASSMPFLQDEWSLTSATLRNRGFGQPSRSTAEDLVEFARGVDPGAIHKGGLADSGVWELEPLADRRAVEFGIALSPEQLICDGEYSPVARQALTDLLPPEVVDRRERGLQSADWPCHFKQRECFEILEEIESCGTARSLFDLQAMRSAIQNWPEPREVGSQVYSTYAGQLPLALAAGVFLKETEEGWTRPA